MSPTARIGYQNLLMLAGLGAMQPNTIVMPLIYSDQCKYDETEFNQNNDKDDNDEKEEHGGDESDTKQKKKSKNKNKDAVSVFRNLPAQSRALVVDSPGNMNSNDYLNVIRDILCVNKNVILTINFHRMHHTLISAKNMRQQVSELSNVTTSVIGDHPKLQNQSINDNNSDNNDNDNDNEEKKAENDKNERRQSNFSDAYLHDKIKAQPQRFQTMSKFLGVKAGLLSMYVSLYLCVCVCFFVCLEMKCD